MTAHVHALAPAGPPDALAHDDPWALVDAEIDQVIASAGARPSTRGKYDRIWDHWVRWCQDNGWEPLDAPFEAFAALVGTFPTRSVLGGAQSVVPVPPNTVKGWFNALIFQYKAADRVPAFLTPEWEAAYSRLREGYVRWFGENSAAAPEQMSPPLLATDVRRLLTFEPELATSGEWSARNTAALLIAAVARCRHQQAAAVRPADIHQRADVPGVTVTVAGGQVTVLCEHPESSGWASGCAACTLRRVSETFTDDSPLVSPPILVRNRIVVMQQSWAAVSGELPRNVLRPADGATPVAWRGFLTALAWSADGCGVRNLATKTRFALMWAMGESAGTAAAAFTVGHVAVNGDGFLVTNPHTGLTLDVQPVNDRDGQPVYGLHAALTEWLNVLAANGFTHDDPLFPTMGRNGLALGSEPLRVVQARRFAQRLAAQAGITTRVTPDSTKTGYIAEAGRRGADLLAVSIATRRRSLDDLNRQMSEHAYRRGNPTQILIQQRAARKDNE